MKLNRKRSERITRLYLLLLSYANERLHVVAPFESVTHLSDDGMHAIATALWGDDRNRHLVADYVAENPHRLRRSDLRQVALWDTAITGEFVSIVNGRDVLFLYDDYTIAVRGLYCEVSGVVGGYACVTTTLLPFESHVVHGVSMRAAPPDPGLSFEHNRQATTDKIYKHVIRTSSDFCKEADAIREEHKALQSPRFACGSSLYLASDAAVAGQHVSPLAGLFGKERDEARLRLKAEREGGLTHARVINLVRRRTSQTEQSRSLEEVFAAVSTDKLVIYASHIGSEVDISLYCLSHEDAARTMARSRAPHDRALISLREAGPAYMHYAARLVAAGGRLETAYEDVRDPDAIPCDIWPYFQSYDTGTSFVTIMVPEFVETLSSVDFDAETQRAERLAEAVRFCTFAVDLRGACLVDDLFQEYFKNERVPERSKVYWDLETVCLRQSDYISLIPCTWDGVRMVESESMYEWDADMLVSPFQSLTLKHQRGKSNRPVTSDMLAYETLLDWTKDTEAAHELIAFLDAHVPDDQDDLNFADDLASDIILDARSPFGRQRYYEDLKNKSYAPTEAQAARLRDLRARLSTTAPCQIHCGWSVQEYQDLVRREESLPTQRWRNSLV